MNKDLLRNFAALEIIRGSYSKKFLPTSDVTFDTKGANFEMALPQKNGSRNQNAFIKINDLGVILLEKRILYAIMHTTLSFCPSFS